jgi:quercetin dioxygenase-like cupin family protein
MMAVALDEKLPEQRRKCTMAGLQMTNTHPTGRTSGTAERPGTEHAGVALTFDLGAEVGRLQAEETWRRQGRNTRTLVKEENLRIVLITMQEGQFVTEHHTAGRLAVQVISGSLRLTVPGRTVDLPTGNLLVLDYAVDYTVAALQEVAFLVTIAWEGTAAA